MCNGIYLEITQEFKFTIYTTQPFSLLFKYPFNMKYDQFGRTSFLTRYNTNIVFYLPKEVTSRQSAELFKTQILGPQTRVIFQASRDRQHSFETPLLAGNIEILSFQRLRTTLIPFFNIQKITIIVTFPLELVQATAEAFPTAAHCAGSKT